MVFDGILIALIIGLLRGGNFKGLAELKVSYGWIFPILLLIQIGVFYLQGKMEWLFHISGFVFILVYIIGLVFLWINRKLGLGVQLIFIGVLLNFVVIVANDGRMPVSVEAAKSLDAGYSIALEEGKYAKHTVLTEKTKLRLLGDILPLPEFYPRKQVISIGDIIMNVGIFVFIQKLMGTKRRNVIPA